MLPRAMPKILALMLCAAIGLLLWRREGPGWLADWPWEALLVSILLPALPLAWLGWRRLRVAIRDMND